MLGHIHKTSNSSSERIIMRVFTKIENKAFEDAYGCIARISVSSAENPSEIRVAGERLGHRTMELINEIGGLVKLEHHFAPMHKEATLKWFINRCVERRIQPREFVFIGVITVIPTAKVVVEHTFIDHNGEFKNA